jgi:hypothetical protein
VVHGPNPKTDDLYFLVIAFKNQVTQMTQLVANQVEMTRLLDFRDTAKQVELLTNQVTLLTSCSQIKLLANQVNTAKTIGIFSSTD